MSLSQDVRMENSLLVLKHFKKETPQANADLFQYVNEQHHHNTRGALSKNVKLPQVRTTKYGLESIQYKSAKDWNYLLNTMNIDPPIQNMSNHLFVKALKSYFFT